MKYMNKKINNLYYFSDRALFNSLDYGTKEEILEKIKNEFIYKQKKEIFDNVLDICTMILKEWNDFISPNRPQHLTGLIYSLFACKIAINNEELSIFLDKFEIPLNEINYVEIKEFQEEKFEEYIKDYIKNIDLNEQKNFNLSKIFS